MTTSKYHEMYGHFCGGDPRLFTPDAFYTYPEEHTLHMKHCKALDDLGIPVGKGVSDVKTVSFELTSGERINRKTGVVETYADAPTIVHYLNYGLGVQKLLCEGTGCFYCQSEGLHCQDDTASQVVED